jgi:metal-responsive CopG/Arc/MetJ family transcriptional regulator
MSAKTRINITVDRETLRLADREARRGKTSRSNFIRTAVRAVASVHEKEQADAARLERQRKAVETMDRMAQKAGTWPAGEILHAWRYRLEKGKN